MTSSSSDIVTSLEAIRSKVLGVIHVVERETKDVTTVYNKKNIPIDPAAIIDFVRSKKALSEARNLDELSERLMSLTVTDDGDERQMRLLKRAIEKEMSFAYLLNYLCPELRKVYDRYLRRFCLSFEREAGQLGLDPVIEYENNITKWKVGIEDRFASIGIIVKERSAVDRPSLAHHLADHQTTLQSMMTDTCQSLRHICELMKAWVMTDFAYVHRLQDEMNDCTHRRNEMKQTIKTVEAELERQQVKVKRQEFSTTQARQVIQKVRNDKDESKTRLKDLDKKLRGIGVLLVDLRKQLLELRLRLEDEEGRQRVRSLEERDRLQDESHRLRQRIRDLEEKSETVKYEVRSVQARQVDNEKDADSRAQALKTTGRQQEKVREEVERLDGRLKGLRMERAQLAHQLVALRRIRDAKTNPQTLRHIQMYGYTPGMTTAALPGEDDLDCAIKIVAGEIGRDWVWLYHKLSFQPLRTHQQKTRDLEEIELSQNSSDDTKSTAMKSLKAWRRLSKSASNEELVQSLKKIKRMDIAAHVQSEILAMQ